MRASIAGRPAVSKRRPQMAFVHGKGSMMFAWLGFGPGRQDLIDLLVPWTHSPHIRRHRGEIVVSRVRTVSTAFAILTPLWIVVDILAFAPQQWSILAVLRVLAAVAFAILAKGWPQRRSLTFAYGILAGMLAIPPAFFLAAQPLLLASPGGDFLAALSIRAYSYLPFIVVAGLSIFPLTVLEVLAASTPVAAAVTAVALLQASFHELLGIWWFMVLVIGVSAISGMSQLHYMIALIDQAARDPLTGAMVRRSGEEALDLHFRIACRTDQPLAVAFMDVDDFKAVNDRWGHESGDQVLNAVAKGIRQQLRQSDTLIRWGGEEFLVILPNTGASGLRQIAHRFRAGNFGFRPDGSPVTVSVGFAERLADATRDWGVLVTKADQRMYDVKASGKNGCLAPPVHEC